MSRPFTGFCAQHTLNLHWTFLRLPVSVELNHWTHIEQLQKISDNRCFATKKLHKLLML